MVVILITGALDVAVGTFAIEDLAARLFFSVWMRRIRFPSPAPGKAITHLVIGSWRNEQRKLLQASASFHKIAYINQFFLVRPV